VWVLIKDYKQTQLHNTPNNNIHSIMFTASQENVLTTVQKIKIT
jgi:hypothetical protein